MAPPAVAHQEFDLERLGVSEDLSGGSALQTATRTGRRSQTPAGREIASPAAAAGHRSPLAKSARKLLIAALAACAVVLGLIAAALEFTKARRASEAAPPSAIDEAEAVGPAAADEDLQTLRKHLGELSLAGPLSPLRNTRLGQSLWLHMTFQRDTTVACGKGLLVKDLSGLNHHGICRRGRLVPGRAGDALECETPLRLLAAAVNQVPQFTLLAWVRCPRSDSTAWWFDEDSGGQEPDGRRQRQRSPTPRLQQERAEDLRPDPPHEACAAAGAMEFHRPAQRTPRRRYVADGPGQRPQAGHQQSRSVPGPGGRPGAVTPFSPTRRKSNSASY